jgi:hypothetical protein
MNLSFHSTFVASIPMTYNKPHNHLSRWAPRFALCSVYGAWIGGLYLAAKGSGALYGGIFAFLGIMLWLPYDIYRYREDLSPRIPMLTTVTIGVGTLVFIIAWFGKSIDSKFIEYFMKLMMVGLGAFLNFFEMRMEEVQEKKAAVKMQEFISERKKAPRVKPVLRFAGRPNERQNNKP